MIHNTIHPLITFTGSGLVGFFMGMFLRRTLIIAEESVGTAGRHQRCDKSAQVG